LEDLYGTYSTNMKRIELVSADEYSKRMTNLLSKPVDYYPVAIIEGTSCRVYPSTMTSLFVYYIKNPTVPIFDYYIDADYQIQPLAASASRTLTAGEYGSAGQTSGTTVTSLTAELNIPTELHTEFAQYLASQIAVRDRDQLLYQAAENEKQ